jgi:hypothetical protein
MLKIGWGIQQSFCRYKLFDLISELGEKPAKGPPGNKLSANANSLFNIH